MGKDTATPLSLLLDCSIHELTHLEQFVIYHAHLYTSGIFFFSQTNS